MSADLTDPYRHLILTTNEGVYVDNVDEIIEKAISYTDDVLGRDPGFYTVAREGLERLRETLHARDRHNHAISKLDEYLNELRRRFPN